MAYALDRVAPDAPALIIAAPVGATLPKPALSGTAEAGAIISETHVYADKSKDVYDFAVSNKTYMPEHWRSP